MQQSVIELMGFLNPHLKNVEDFRHKLWDHLFLISDFKLDVSSPYPIPTAETLKPKSDPLPYPKRYPKHAHLGKNLELIIRQSIAGRKSGKEKRFANAIAYYMKLAYNNWHKETVHDDAIQGELSAITNGQLEFTNTPFVRSFRPSRKPGKKRTDMDMTAINAIRNFNGTITTVTTGITTTGTMIAEANSKRKDISEFL